VSVVNEDNDKEKDEVRWVSGLRNADAKNWKNMQSRMGRKAIFGALKTT
jgi:hypothetical protein